MDLESQSEDIISKLPRDVLRHILSRLETEDAVRTCVLSSRWKDLWTSIYNLHFNDRVSTLGCSYNFVNFVDNVISRYQSQVIQNFSIKFQVDNDVDEILSRVVLWISFAIEHKVQNLEIHVGHNAAIGNWFRIRLPQSILTCKTLVKLKLDSRNCDFTFDILDSTPCFPSLKILYIEVVCSSGNIMQKLFRSCSKLEKLTIHGDELVENSLTFDITVPTLKTLNIYMVQESCETVSMHKFVVRAPNLEQLDIDDDCLAWFVMDETPFIRDAYLVGCFSLLSHYRPTKTEANRAMDILRAVKNTKFLSLSAGIMGVLIFAFDDNLPTFPNLINMEAGIDSYYGWKLLPYLLNNSPNLEVLTIEKDDIEDLPLERFSYFEAESVPSCLILRVKKINMISMKAHHDELEVIRYLLKNSKVLEKFLVHFHCVNSIIEEYLQYQITRFPRGSNLCKIEFR